MRTLLPVIVACAVGAAPAWGAAERLPDMRWVFDRAQRVAGDPGADRVARVRSWALVRLLYPQDEPGTENDDVWRSAALDALVRLDARAAGFPPPGPAQARPAVPGDPLREVLGVRLADRPGGAPALAEVLRPGCGLAAGDRILACDGHAVASVADCAGLVQRAAATGRLALQLDRGRRLDLLLGPAGPQVMLARWHGTLEAWELGSAWELPPIDGAWAVEVRGDAGADVRLDGAVPAAAPAATVRTAVSATGRARLEVRRSSSAGAFACTATPLRGAWRQLQAAAARPARLATGVRAGQPLVVETTAADAHVLQAQGPGSAGWSILPLPAGARQRLALHGPAGALAAQAIEGNGVLVLTVAPASAGAAAVALRILAPDHAWIPAEAAVP